MMVVNSFITSCGETLATKLKSLDQGRNYINGKYDNVRCHEYFKSNYSPSDCFLTTHLWRGCSLAVGKIWCVYLLYISSFVDQITVTEMFFNLVFDTYARSKTGVKVEFYI